jgi:FkbM family methyltransferase
MQNLILKRINQFLATAQDKNYREYLRLLYKYGSKRRNEKTVVDFLNYRIEVPDCPSFVFQFKDIFLKNTYRFNSDNGQPLIYDCGANIGVSCIYFKELFPAAKIKAFEADPLIADILLKNLTANGINDVEVFAKAIWKNNRKISFSPDGADGGSIKKEGSVYKVEAIRLKDLLLKEEKIDLLKMDIEGAEVEVIIDCNKTLKVANKIFVEFHSWKNDRKRLDVLLNVLEENGFAYYIESISKIESPLLNSNITNKDLQLNIFAINTNNEHQRDNL